MSASKDIQRRIDGGQELFSIQSVVGLLDENRALRARLEDATQALSVCMFAAITAHAIAKADGSDPEGELTGYISKVIDTAREALKETK